jgi:anti-anti-sigma factor
MGIVVEQSEGSRVVALEGAIDIACAAELKTALLEAFADGQPWTVSLAAATYLDVTALQLLWAANRQARALAGQAQVEVTGLQVSGKIPEPVAESLADAGFESFLVS